MTDSQHDELRRKFDALRAKDAHDAPPFEPMWRRALDQAASLPRVRRMPVPLIAAAAVVVAVVGISLVRFGAGSETQVAADSAAAPQRRAETISTWRAPTDVLLRYPGRDVLDAPKPFGASAIDRFIPESKLIKGE